VKLSSKTHYGLMACHILAAAYPNETVSATALENAIGVSGKYLEKIMRILSGKGVVAANRGANGGYYLAAPPEDITIGVIVRALEDDMKIIDCVGSGGACKCCPSSKVWKKLYDGINGVLDGMNLKQLLEGEIR